MTHQNHQTNGASLEDCHTNFFALTDLCGIKWRKFVNGERPNASSDPQDDPILRSYSRCMQADILCVWRRVQSTKQENTDPNAYSFETSSTKVHPPLSLAAAKELWIFWYGEEPDLSELVDGELLRTSANQMMWAGTWERGLSYECRSLLFKALHNLMERFVLTKDIVRFGKWFVQPCTSNEHIFGRSSQHLSFSFTFFVHGDTVCASIDLREHPAVRPLRKEHLVEAAAAYTTATNTQSQEENSLNSPGNNVSGNQLDEDARTKLPPKQRKVILAPFGGAATLTGNSYKATDPMAEKILEEWTSFFPMCNKDNSDVPPVVEIISGGHKMYYPSIYVLVTDLDDMEEMETLLLQKDAIGTTSSTEAAVLAALSTANPTDQLNRKSVAMDLKPPILTTTTSITSTVASIEKKLHNDQFKTLQYYDNSINNYTCNTANTHAAPQAATEMPERAWQDCITNTLHVSYSCATTSSSSSTVLTPKIENDSGNGVTQMDNASGVNNTNNSNNSNMIDSKQLVQQSIQQQQQKQQQFWGFVDPTQKAPCICTKYQFSNKKSTTSSTGGSLISSLSTTLRMNSTMSLAMPKMHSHSSSSNNGGHYSGSHLLHHRQSSNSEKSISTRAPRVPFHKRQHYQRVDGNSTSTAPDKNSNNASTNAKLGNSKSHTIFGETTNATFGTFYQTTADTIPKPRTLANTTTPHGTPHGGASTYSRNSIGDSMHVPSVGSPGTPAPSPHPNSTLSQPTSVPPAEQLLNMSPRQPTSVSNLQQPPTPIDHLLDKNTPAPTPTDQHDNKSITASPYVHPTPSVEPPPSAEGLHNCGGIGGPGSVSQPPSVGRSTPTIAQQQQQQPLITVKKFDTQALTPLPGVVLPVNCNRNGTSNQSATGEVHDFLKLYKTPALIVKDIDSFANENCLKLEGLYDFSSQDAWVNHQMQPKRFKPNELTKTCRTMRTKNLYDGHTHIKPLMPSPGSLYGSQLLSIDANQAFNNNDIDSMSTNNGGGLVGIASKNLTNGTDNDTSNSSNFFQGLDIKSEVLSNMSSPCKESKSSVGGNLYTAEGLNPSFNDLEQIFETSSNEDCNSVQIHTPPDSNNPSNGSAATNTIEDLKRSTAVSTVAAVSVSSSVGVVAIAALQNCNNTMSTNVNSSGANTIQAEDLTKMFPTPPSHEQHHPNSSPCQMDIQMTDLSVNTITSLPHLDTALGIIKIKQEFPDELGSPIDEPIEDWSYVYKPPQNAKFVGSSKYAPLTNLLQPLIVPNNCIYKPSWTKQQSRVAAAAQAAVQQQIQQQHQHQQQQQQQQQHQHQHQRQQQQLQNQHQQLHELLSAAPRTPLQQPRTPINHMPSPMHSTVPQPLSSGGSSLLLNQLNCPQAALTNTPGGNVASMQQLMQRAGMSPISPAPGAAPFPRGSPMMQPQRHTPIHPPPPYEMAVASPATSTSSYLNKQYNSQEPPRTPQSVGMPTHAGGLHNATGNLATNTDMCFGSASNRDIPEVSSLLVNILLYDTALNVFRDHNFDSSTVCVCNADSQKIGNIRGADSGVYVPLPGNSFHPTSSSSVLSVLTGNNTNMRIMSAFGGNGGSALDSPASLPGAGSGHTGSNSSSCTTPASNPHITGYVDDDPVDCTCGFSAVVNRRLAYRAGLFYEDEFEITGIAEDSIRHKSQSFLSLFTNLSAALKPSTKQSNAVVPVNADKSIVQVDQLAHSIFDLLMDQCSIIQTSSSSIHRALRRHRRRLETENKLPQTTATVTNVLELLDANDIMSLALEQARIAFDSQRMDVNDFSHQHQLSLFHSGNRKNSAMVNNISVHKWPYIPAGFTRSNKEIVRTMNSIQPMLQNAFHSKSRSAAGTKDATYTVSGPLTWRQFHRLAGRASGQCEPQPIPSVIVGHEKDWISIAPLAIHYWDKFLLEPYSYARDVVYLIVCPDDEYVSSKAKSYFKELSTTYEMCKLGRHTPIKGWDGMLTVSPQMAQDSFTTPLDEWLRTLDDTNLAEKIRVYANAFHNMISPYLNRIPGDKTLLNPPDNSNNSNAITRERISTSPSANNVTNMIGTSNALESERIHNSPKIENTNSTVEQPAEQHNIMDTKTEQKPAIVLGDPLGMGETMEDINSPAIVLYVVEPFSFGRDSPQLERLACIVLLRCYYELLKTIPESVKANINIQIISLESILELGCSRNRKRFSDEIKALALNIFSQCRRHMVHAQAVKSLTGFGTAANMEVFLKSKDEKNRRPYKMYTPPYVLAPVHEKNDKADFSRTTSSMRSVNEQKYSVMYCNYCISEDQSWLLATVTDDRGELLEKMCINIEVPNRTRRRKAPARKIGLKKLMDFIMGVISQTVQPWRLVIGRIGRIGHSELKSWSYLLSKPNLQKASKQLKDLCKQCSLMYPPSILSACLVTLEPDSQLRVMPDQFTPDERFSQISMQNPLSTPQDVTCTHILVFPTSAVCLPFTRQFQNEPQVDLDNDFLNFDDCEDENEGFATADLMGDLLNWGQQLGRTSNNGSPDRLEDNRSWQSAGGNFAQQQEIEEVGSINQQPLAVGYMVSTAPTGRMPKWFWAACPHLENVCPVFLKTALHLHVPNIQIADDILNSTNAHSSANDHALDSTLTADVLRYVLEGYNALSWLALDSNTHDRLSCLPINVQTLMDLYYLIAAIA